MGILNSLPLVS